MSDLTCQQDNSNFVVDLEGCLVDYKGIDELIAIPDKVIAIGSNVFKGNRFIKTVIIPNSVLYIYDFAFADCTNLEKVYLSDNLIYIGKSAFKRCFSLSNILLPNKLVAIDEYAFFGCISLLSVEIPDNVKMIRENSFPNRCTLNKINNTKKNDYKSNKVYPKKEITEGVNYSTYFQTKKGISHKICDYYGIISFLEEIAHFQENFKENDEDLRHTVYEKISYLKKEIGEIITIEMSDIIRFFNYIMAETDKSEEQPDKKALKNILVEKSEVLTNFSTNLSTAQCISAVIRYYNKHDSLDFSCYDRVYMKYGAWEYNNEVCVSKYISLRKWFNCTLMPRIKNGMISDELVEEANIIPWKQNRKPLYWNEWLEICQKIINAGETITLETVWMNYYNVGKWLHRQIRIFSRLSEDRKQKLVELFPNPKNVYDDLTKISLLSHKKKSYTLSETQFFARLLSEYKLFDNDIEKFNSISKTYELLSWNELITKFSQSAIAKIDRAIRETIKEITEREFLINQKQKEVEVSESEKQTVISHAVENIPKHTTDPEWRRLLNFVSNTNEENSYSLTATLDAYDEYVNYTDDYEYVTRQNTLHYDFDNLDILSNTLEDYYYSTGQINKLLNL